MNKSLAAIPLCVVLTASAYADTTIVNGPMRFNPIVASAYDQTTTEPDILNTKPWVIPDVVQ